MNKLIQAVIYTRTSTIRQSVDRQVNELKEVKGFQVKKTFTESISGFTKSIEERPKLQSAIKYMLDNDVECLMVHEISRLGRRTSEVLVLLEELKKHGKKVYIKSLDMMINGNGATEAINKLVVTLLADLARMESETMSYRIKSGLMERKRKGLALGRQLGSTEDRDKFLNKYKKVIDKLDQGESIRTIAKKLSMSPTTVMKVKQTHAAM
jgi:DNA invertase Pin-like site-specific DNA recombinase